jgi:hypothetical protein
MPKLSMLITPLWLVCMGCMPANLPETAKARLHQAKMPDVGESHQLSLASESNGEFGYLEQPSDLKNHNLLFVTSGAFTGDFLAEYDHQSFVSGYDGANYRCQKAAENSAHPTRRWHALVAGNDLILDELSYRSYPIYNLAGEFLVDSHNQLIGTKEIPLIDRKKVAQRVLLDENGELVVSNRRVWSGQDLNDGAHNCDHWSTSSDNLRAQYGLISTDPRYWWHIDSYTISCNRALRLYCISIPDE